MKQSELQLDSKLGKWESMYVFYRQNQHQKRPLLFMPTWQETNSWLKCYKLLYFCHTKWDSKSFWTIGVFSSVKQNCGNSVGAAVLLGPPLPSPKVSVRSRDMGAGPEGVFGGESRRGAIMTHSSLLLSAVGPPAARSPFPPADFTLSGSFPLMYPSSAKQSPVSSVPRPGLSPYPLYL